MRTLLFFALIFTLPTFADEEILPLTETVNATEFFTRITGEYTVDLAGGEKPHEGTELGIVMIEDASGLISFSYCQPDGLCDPNDQYFPLSTVTVTKTTLSPSAISYELSYVENNVTKKFTWDEVGNQISFKNYQYLLQEKLITLEHQFHRKTEIVSTDRIILLEHESEKMPEI